MRGARVAFAGRDSYLGCVGDPSSSRKADTRRGTSSPLAASQNNPPDLLPRRVFFFPLASSPRPAADIERRQNRQKTVIQLLHGALIAASDASASTEFSEQE